MIAEKSLVLRLGLILLMLNTVSSVPAATETPKVDIHKGGARNEYWNEVNDYFNEQKSKDHIDVDINTRQSNALRSGDTVALQTYARSFWLSCFPNYCCRSGCPYMHMTGSDWVDCSGVVFEIYKAFAPGRIRCGDLVGLHYPHEAGHWLGCPGNACQKASCPGIPNITHGFASEDHWFRCWGEVFRIYANSKSYGDVINSGDDIMLYYIQGDTWVAQDGGNTQKLPCPGKVRPPPFEKFDGCAWETFTIWK